MIQLEQVKRNVRKYIAEKDNDKMLKELNEYCRLQKILGYDYRSVRRLAKKDFGIELKNERKPFVKPKEVVR